MMRSLVVIPSLNKRGALTLLLLSLSLALNGCESLGLGKELPDQRLAYKRQREAAENLEIPPDLLAGSFEDALEIPGGERAATFSEYAGSRAQRQQVAAQGGEVLPSFQGVELKRRGDDRWLEVQAPPQAVWPRLVAFWREQGILLVEQNPKVGLMRTDWLENRAEIRKDFITRMVSKIAEGLYSTATRDQYTLRIEEGLKPGTTEIRLTHRGMSERLIEGGLGDSSRTIWEPSGSDREKEAEMLRRLMVYLGAPPSKAEGPGTEVAAAQVVGANSRLISENGVPVILIPQPFRNSWRLIGIALDRAGFAVEDRDQSQGIYYVRYAGRETSAEAPKPGLISRLAFWRKPKVDPVKQYQVKVSGNEQESRVTVLAADGSPDTSAEGQRILGLIQEQLR